MLGAGARAGRETREHSLRLGRERVAPHVELGQAAVLRERVAKRGWHGRQTVLRE